MGIAIKLPGCAPIPALCLIRLHCAAGKSQAAQYAIVADLSFLTRAEDGNALPVITIFDKLSRG